jgi:ABC-type amino acid transport system permease subunit
MCKAVLAPAVKIRAPCTARTPGTSFFVFFGLPSAGARLTPELAPVIAMVINLGAYATEIVRAGVQGTPGGQIEAAHSLALTPAQVFVRVVLPPSTVARALRAAPHRRAQSVPIGAAR